MKKRVLRGILCVVLAVAVSVAFSGCANRDKRRVERITAQYIEDFVNMDYENMYAVSKAKTEYFKDIYKPDNDGSRYIFETMSKNLKYEYVDTKIDGTEGMVTYKISNIDMNTIMSEVMNAFLASCVEQELTSEQMDSVLDQMIEAGLSDEDAPIKSANTVFNLEKIDGKWIVDDNVLVYDDLTGGYMTFVFVNNTALGAAGLEGAFSESQASEAEETTEK